MVKCAASIAYHDWTEGLVAVWPWSISIKKMPVFLTFSTHSSVNYTSF